MEGLKSKEILFPGTVFRSLKDLEGDEKQAGSLLRQPRRSGTAALPSFFTGCFPFNNPSLSPLPAFLLTLLIRPLRSDRQIMPLRDAQAVA